MSMRHKADKLTKKKMTEFFVNNNKKYFSKEDLATVSNS